MQMRIHADEIARLQASPVPYMVNSERSILGQLMVGEPAVETDDNDNPTGWLLMSHSRITDREVFILDVIRAGWNYADIQDDPDAIIALYTAQEWAMWDALKLQLDAGTIDQARAYEAVWAHVLTVAASLGMTYVPPDEGI